MITFGKFALDKKVKTSNLKGTTYKLYFIDDFENKLTLSVEGSDYSKYEVGDPLDEEDFQFQTRL